MPHSTSVEMFCPAKVNLALSVGGPGADGLHAIASWMVAVDLADRLRLRPADNGRSSFDIDFDRDENSPCRDRNVDWPLEADLAFHAHEALEQQVGGSLPVNLQLRKRIPPGGGLGGGSADAAGVLLGLDRLFELRIDPQRLQQLAHELGSDVPFALAAIGGCPSALVSGFGQRIEPLPLRREIDLVLVLPPLACPTAEVYRAFDALHRLVAGGERLPDPQRVGELAAFDPLPPGAAFNDLAEPACTVEPRLADLRRQIQDRIGQPVHVTGSGSTLFLVAADADQASATAKAVTTTTGVTAIATRTWRCGQ